MRDTPGGVGRGRLSQALEETQEKGYLGRALPERGQH